MGRLGLWRRELLDDVAHLVLEDNRLQTLGLSMMVVLFVTSNFIMFTYGMRLIRGSVNLGEAIANPMANGKPYEPFLSLVERPA